MDMTPSNSATRVVYRNPLDLNRISYADILANAAEGVCIEAPGRVRSFRQQAPLFHDDPDDARVFPPFVDNVVTYPPVFTTSLRDVTLVGFRTALSPQGFFTNDMGHLEPGESSSFVRGLRQFDELSGLVPAGCDGVFEHAVDGRRQVHLEGPVVVLTSVEAGNFGSFLFRELVKLVNLPEIPPGWRFLIHLSSVTCEQYLALAGLPMERVIRHEPDTVYHIDQAIIPGLRNPLALLDPQTRAFYSEMRVRCESGKRGARLYISRHSSTAAIQTGRVMLNEVALIARLREEGFTIVEPQLRTAAEQIEMFASADLVVGPSGSGMFNAVFCRPGTRLIDIESEPHWVTRHNCLFASANLRYGLFEGVAQDRDWSIHHKPWRVNVEALLQRIASFAEQEGPPMSETFEFDAVAASSATLVNLTGEHYTTVLRRLHEVFRPQNYLEIGVDTGGTIALAKCSAIGIDPSFRIGQLEMNDKPACCLYQMTSDSFFRKHNPSAIFGQPVDLAFLDGMHLFEFLLRDFINVEKHAKPNSIIVMHDCLPVDAYVGRRDEDDQALKQQSAYPDWWAGDVWKMMAILMRHRPDLRMVVFDAVPTGLVAITRLDPASSVLADGYFDFVEEYKDQTLTEYGDAYYASLKIADTRKYASLEALSSLFWL